MAIKDKPMTVKEFKKEIEGLPDDSEIIFGSGNLSFYRIKRRGDDCFQIEFNEVYDVTSK